MSLRPLSWPRALLGAVDPARSALANARGAAAEIARSVQERAVLMVGLEPAVTESDDLPDGTAVELLQRLGANPLTALVPVIVLSQEASDLRVLMRLRAAGAAAVIAVPPLGEGDWPYGEYTGAAPAG